jgi:hypothetical protein
MEGVNSELASQITSIAQCITEESDAIKLCDGMKNMVVACKEGCMKLGVLACAGYLGKKFAGCMEVACSIENCLK